MDEAIIDKRRYLLEDAVLLDHVGGVEDGAGEHGLPVQGGGFRFELADINEPGSSMRANAPCGAMSSTISSKCWSVWVRPMMYSTYWMPSLRTSSLSFLE